LAGAALGRGCSHTGDFTACSVGWWLLADGWCWFVLREEYCWLVAGGWFDVREKYCWLLADKPSEQGFDLHEINYSFRPKKRMMFSDLKFVSKRMMFYLIWHVCMCM
jgi:hypothetical protein